MQRKDVINIQGLDKAEVLAALYNNSKIQGMGFFGQRAPGNKAGKAMTIEEAREEITTLERNGRDLYFDYLHGKVMKVDLSSDELNPWGYDRDNGTGTAEAVIKEIRKNANRIDPKEEKPLYEKKLDKVNDDLKQNPQDVLNNANNSLRIFAISKPLALLGRESDLNEKELKKLDVDISFSGKILHFPQLKSGDKLVCAYNQFGMPGMAKMYECYSIENMQELYNSYSKGGAITIDWYAMADKKLDHTMHVNHNNSNFGGLRRGFMN